MAAKGLCVPGARPGRRLMMLNCKAWVGRQDGSMCEFYSLGSPWAISPCRTCPLSLDEVCVAEPWTGLPSRSSEGVPPNISLVRAWFRREFYVQLLRSPFARNIIGGTMEPLQGRPSTTINRRPLVVLSVDLHKVNHMIDDLPVVLQAG
jgi:hypothetical protein